MNRLVGGGALIALALFMLLGFLGSELDPSAPAAIGALLLTVGLPAVAGGALIASHLRGGRRLADRREQLRIQTVEAELLRLAGRHGGKLTVVEAVTETGLSTEDVKAALDALVRRQSADLEVTDSGVIVYDFHEVRNLGDKSTARGVLDD